MKRLCALCAVLYALLWSPAYADPLPASLYPEGSVLSSSNPMENAEYDCAWSFDCSNWDPVFHRKSGDVLGRVDGWGQWGHKGSGIYFVVIVSNFITDTKQSAAFLDLQHQLKTNKFYAPSEQHEKALLPAAASTFRLRSGQDTITVVAAEYGTRLIEAAEMHNRQKYTQSKAMGYLLNQIKAAEAT